MALPVRAGPRPTTTPTNPYTQLDQQPTDATLSNRLATRVFTLPGVLERESAISVAGARALWLDDSLPAGPAEAFLIGREFAHLHPGSDQSLHAMLPPVLVEEAIDAGWAEQHPVARRGLIPANAVMLYAPRDDGSSMSSRVSSRPRTPLPRPLPTKADAMRWRRQRTSVTTS